MKITRALIMAHKPCSTNGRPVEERVDGFLACFPGGKVTLKGARKAAKAGYTLHWVAVNLLPPGSWQTYYTAMAKAQKVFFLGPKELDHRGKDFAKARVLAFYQAFNLEE